MTFGHALVSFGRVLNFGRPRVSLRRVPMPTIEVSQETLDRLKALAEPLVDTADSVIARLIAAQNGQRSGSVHVELPASRPETRRPAGAPRKRGRKGERARKGERTPTEGFYEPLLEVLASAGGQLAAVEAIDRVGRAMDSKLKDVDRARLPSGEVRWRNSVRWARQRLEEQGKLDPKAPYGIWKLA